MSFLFTKFGVILLILKLFRSCWITQARELYCYESIIQNGIESVASLIKNGNSDGAKEFESINIYKLTALSELKKEYSGNSYGSG